MRRLAAALVAALVGLTMVMTIEQAAAQVPPPPGFRPPPPGFRPPPPPVRPAPPPRRRGPSGKGIAAGIAAGVVGAIILNEAARASRGERRYSCRSLDRLCDDGERWACRRFEDQCE